MAKLWRFPGGFRLPGHKRESTYLPVIPARLPSRLILPLQQHIGAPAKALVTVGDKVIKGQMIAQADGYVSAPVHAPTSGIVTAIGDRPIPHPSGLNAPCIVIEPDGEETWGGRHRVENYAELDPSALRNIIREAGVVGLGGASFPTYIKLNPSIKTVDTLILNGVECEPYITCDDMLMRERPQQIIAGLLVMRHALHTHRCIIGVEDNKPEASAALKQAIRELRVEGMEVVEVPTLYPAGGEKQLIKVLTGKEVPSNGLPIHIGIVCQNVATAVAVYRAIEFGEPLISRYVTVTGPDIPQPRNLETLLGTPISELIKQCGGAPADAGMPIMGGPMMGFPLHSIEAPVVKATNCVLVGTDVVAKAREMPCIRCGACHDACPVSLLPQQLYWHARGKDFDKIQEYNLFDCIECGCCTAVCPSNIPLVQYYRFAKAEIWAKEREKQKADVARARHEFRLQRIEREKREREKRHEQKKAALATSNVEAAEESANGKDTVAPAVEKEPKKAAILAAMERAQAKRKDS